MWASYSHILECLSTNSHLLYLREILPAWRSCPRFILVSSSPHRHPKWLTSLISTHSHSASHRKYMSYWTPVIRTLRCLIHFFCALLKSIELPGRESSMDPVFSYVLSAPCRKITSSFAFVIKISHRDIFSVDSTSEMHGLIRPWKVDRARFITFPLSFISGKFIVWHTRVDLFVALYLLSAPSTEKWLNLLKAYRSWAWTENWWVSM